MKSSDSVSQRLQHCRPVLMIAAIAVLFTPLPSMEFLLTCAFGTEQKTAGQQESAPSQISMTPVICEKCGQLVGGNQSRGHRCESAPLSHLELERRKAAAHALSRGQDEEFRLRSSAGMSDSPPLSDFIRNQSVAVALGKALFWDMRVGSDDRTACATCHHHAGADTRTKNTATTTDEAADHNALLNKQWRKSDHTPWIDDGVADSKRFGLIAGDSSVVIGSQGVRSRELDCKDFRQQVENGVERIVERGVSVDVRLPAFRQVTKRNSPTVINSGRLARLFHDGRAEDVFNGYDVFGPDSPYKDDLGKYRVHRGRLERVEIAIPQAAAASQAMGPPVSSIEMSYQGRDFSHIAYKLLDTVPLLDQAVSANDSVLGSYVCVKPGSSCANGLNLTYRQLIEKAFHEVWWNQRDLILPGEDENPHQKDNCDKPRIPVKDMMVANFSLYFGLAVMAYEQTLISDEAPFDKFMRGESIAMSPQAHAGFQRFVSHGCADCHLLPEFAGATIAATFGEAKEEVDEYEEALLQPRPLPKPLNPDGSAFVEERLFKVPERRFRAYDNGFYNIGVTGLIKGKFDLGLGRELEFTPNKANQKPVPSYQANFNPDGRKSLTRKAEQQLKLEQLQKSNGGEEDSGAADDSPSGTVRLKSFQISRARRLFPHQSVRKDQQSAVKGAFKTPSLRNVTLTAPYMHNGAFLTLKEVIRFYRYGPRLMTGDDEAKSFHHPELELLRQSLAGASDDDELLAFLAALTDPRVETHSAPFDHPSLTLPSGNKSDAVGDGNGLDEVHELPAIGGQPTPEQLRALQTLPNWISLED